MKLLRRLWFLVLISSLALGQATTSNPSSDPSNLSDEVKQLREMMAEQQKAMQEQQRAMAEQQQRLADQQQEIERLRQQLTAQPEPVVANNKGNSEPRLVNASLTASPTTVSATAQPVATQTQPQPPEAQGAKSPLSFRIGAAEFTPGGFVDFENVFRTTNTGNVSATSFGSIPFSNVVQGHLSEYRATGQYSRFNLKTTAKYGKNDITGYIEFDFNGNDASNVFVTSNSHTDRLRLYWLDLRRDKWEFLGGQTWGLQTPNRVGVSPNPADLSLGYHEDAGIGVGYNYTRAAEFRAAYHFNSDWVWAGAIQNPDQFTNGEVLFPAAFNAQAGVQFDAANQTTTPNVAPDFLTKIAYDHDFSGRHFHWEGGGLETTVKATVLPTVTGASFHSSSSVGGGVFGDILADLFKGSEGRNIRFVASGMWGYGIGRYLNGLAPQAVLVPVNASGATCSIVGTTTRSAVGCDARVSQIHAGDMVAGFEFLPHPKHQFGVYYGGLYAQRNSFTDITSTAAIQPIIGFGGPGSGNNNNRAVQEGTIDWTTTFWKDPQYGAVLLITQASYVTRAPWFVSKDSSGNLTQPKNAHLTMGYVSLRYVLP